MKRIRQQRKWKRLFKHGLNIRQIIFITTALCCCIPNLFSPAMTLLLGFLLSLIIGKPYSHDQQKTTQLLLQGSVIGLGFSMQLNSVLEVGKTGFLLTVIFLISALTLGHLIGKFLKIEQRTSFLIAAGTAICGGSAISALSPVIQADDRQLSVALGTVFILNSIALFIFPAIGHICALSQVQFGIWSAIAIHDTSSVVGAASKYGAEALTTATTAKLGRALWIIPLAFLSTFLFKNQTTKIKIPWFIGLFILAMIANSFLPFIQQFQQIVNTVAKSGFTLTLFLIGNGLDRKLFEQMGLKPLLQGVLLWVIISATSLLAVIALI